MNIPFKKNTGHKYIATEVPDFTSKQDVIIIHKGFYQLIPGRTPTFLLTKFNLGLLRRWFATIFGEQTLLLIAGTT